MKSHSDLSVRVSNNYCGLIPLDKMCFLKKEILRKLYKNIRMNYFYDLVILFPFINTRKFVGINFKYSRGKCYIATQYIK